MAVVVVVFAAVVVVADEVEVATAVVEDVDEVMIGASCSCEFVGTSPLQELGVWPPGGDGVGIYLSHCPWAAATKVPLPERSIQSASGNTRSSQTRWECIAEKKKSLFVVKNDNLNLDFLLLGFD